jgi:hypothetical protein
LSRKQVFSLPYWAKEKTLAAAVKAVQDQMYLEWRNDVKRQLYNIH